MRKTSITKAIRFVQAKLPENTSNAKQANVHLFGKASCRQDLNKQQDNLVTCFVDDGYYNYYNIDRIMDGKVKAFKGNTPKERLICALEGLYSYCD